MNFGKFVAFCTLIAFENCDGKCKKRRRLKKYFFGSCPKMGYDSSWCNSCADCWVKTTWFSAFNITDSFWLWFFFLLCNFEGVIFSLLYSLSNGWISEWLRYFRYSLKRLFRFGTLYEQLICCNPSWMLISKQFCGWMFFMKAIFLRMLPLPKTELGQFFAPVCCVCIMLCTQSICKQNCTIGL